MVHLQIEIWRVENFELEPVPEGTYGFFFGGDSYVMKYTYEIDGNERYIIYFWQVCVCLSDVYISVACVGTLWTVVCVCVCMYANIYVYITMKHKVTL